MIKPGAMVAVAAKAIERTLVDLVEQGYDTKQDPYGAPWPSRQDGLPHPLLELSGNMRDSFCTFVTASSVTIQNSAEYSHFHQFGTSVMPQRSFFPDAGLPFGWKSRINLEITLSLKAFT